MLWVKSLHVISIIAWMAGLLYLPRLMVYHAETQAGTAQSETFKIMERRLLKAIMTPAMISSWFFGLWLIVIYGVGWNDGSFWLHAKLLCVLIMSGVHGVLSRHVREFAKDANTKPQSYFRILNEVPTVLMLLIVVLVIVKPF